MSTFYKLRRFNPQTDLEYIYRIYSDYHEQYKLFSVMNLNTYESFREKFENKLSTNYKDFLIIDVEGKFAGFLISYDYKHNDGHIKFMTYYEKEYRSGFIGLAAIEFVDILFHYYNVHKVYTEVYSYNEESIKYHKKGGFEEECRLKDYRYYNGQYWDQIYYSCTRDAFYSHNKSIIDRYLRPFNGC